MTYIKMFYALTIIALCTIILAILIDLCKETVQKVVKKKEESGHTGTNFAKLMVVCGYIIIIGAVIVLALGGIIYILTN